jgi:hypothetical protein
MMQNQSQALYPVNSMVSLYQCFCTELGSDPMLHRILRQLTNLENTVGHEYVCVAQRHASKPFTHSTQTLGLHMTKNQ